MLLQAPRESPPLMKLLDESNKIFLKTAQKILKKKAMEKHDHQQDYILLLEWKSITQKTDPDGWESDGGGDNDANDTFLKMMVITFVIPYV